MGHPVSGLFDRQFNTLANALSARERMQSVYAANIANADTPNYHADTRSFADFLAERQAATGGTAQLATTQPGQIATADSSSWHGTLNSHNASARRMDGNSVDLQQEMAGMAQNQLMHDMTMRLIKKRLDMVANVVREAGR